MVLNITDPNFHEQLPANFTQAQLTTFIKNRFTACGFPIPTAESLDVTDKIGYTLSLNPSAVYGEVKFIVEISISGNTATVRARLYHSSNYDFTTFTEVAQTGANNTTGATFTFITDRPLNVYSVPMTEELFGCVFVEGETTFKGVLGIIYPSIKESWYDENQYVFAQLLNPGTPNSAWLPYPNPRGVSATTAIITRYQQNTFANRNPLNNKAQIITQPHITFYNWGIGARFGANIGISNNDGFQTNDISVITPNVEEWWNLWEGDNGVVIRCV